MASQTADTARAASILGDLDTQLMLQVRQGDREAAANLIRRNRDRVVRYVTRLVRDTRAAEDIGQDVFVQALSHPEQYQPTAKVVTWLYRIATNCALNYLKQPGVRRKTAPPPGFDIPDTSSPAPDRALSLDELRQQVSQAILTLPVNQRAALTLFEYEECSYEQIAAVLDVTVESVRSLLLRARTTLRQRLQGLV